MIELFDRLLSRLHSFRDSLVRYKIKQRLRRGTTNQSPKVQDLDIYWDQGFVNSLETWGEKTVWLEIQFLLANLQGRVLDIACGTGRAIWLLRKFDALDVYGCDLSDLNIKRAAETGISLDRLRVCDATETPYPDDSFDYSYSIGSLEHFTEDGVSKFIKETSRITRKNSFHQVPTSRSNENEGWLQLDQSYFNNQVDWWLEKFAAVYDDVIVLDSSWQDPISVGKWFVCRKDGLGRG
jgi:ubiquinone/menaquinone biosynthesis C-methylase UbiE